MLWWLLACGDPETAETAEPTGTMDPAGLAVPADARASAPNDNGIGTATAERTEARPAAWPPVSSGVPVERPGFSFSGTERTVHLDADEGLRDATEVRADDVWRLVDRELTPQERQAMRKRLGRPGSQ